MKHVTCFGEILWDNFPTGKMPGGAPMNVAMHLYKQGINTKLISSVGSDENGEELKSFLIEHGISTQYVQENSSLRTGIVDVNLDENKQATYTIVKPVAWDEIQYAENLSKLVNDSDAFVFGSLAGRSDTSYHTLLKLIEASSCSIFDMNLRPPHFEMSTLETLMNKCDVLKLNEHELELLKERYYLDSKIEDQLNSLQTITDTGTICVTLGDKGAIILHDGIVYKHPGYKIKVVDTVGAGDAFLGSFIAGFLNKLPIHSILQRACATGAFVASKAGANPAYTQENITTIIRQPI